jgi:predicted flavoprotein YhiN
MGCCNHGHAIVSPVPPYLHLNKDSRIKELPGVAAQVTVKDTKLSRRDLLITHWEMSGPAVLKLSAWGARILHDTISLAFSNWLNDVDANDARKN